MGETDRDRDKDKSIEQQALSVFKSERIEDVTAIALAAVVAALVLLKILI